MKALAIIAIIVIVGQAQDKTPPVWPEVFSQHFVQSYLSTRLNINGKIYYDATKDMMRVDRANGQFDQYCGPSFTLGECTQLTRDKRRYLYAPVRKLCCMCCEEIHGCGVTERDWLRFASYQGTQNILGQAYDKWFLQTGPIIGHYYATQTSDRIPKRFVDTTSGTLVDYTKITYSTQPIPESTFDLPSFCSPSNLCQASACVRRRNSQLAQQ